MNTYEQNYDEYILNRLKKDPELLSEYIKATVESLEEDGDLRAFLTATQMIAKAKNGGMTGLSKNTGLNRQQLYRMFKSGNPTLKTIKTILDYLGFKLTIQPI